MEGKKEETSDDMQVAGDILRRQNQKQGPIIHIPPGKQGGKVNGTIFEIIIIPLHVTSASHHDGCAHWQHKIIEGLTQNCPKAYKGHQCL